MMKSINSGEANTLQAKDTKASCYDPLQTAIQYF